MKKILKYAILLLVVLSATGCSDTLDVTPDGRLTLEGVFNDPDLTEAYFSNCFNYIPKKSRRYFWFSNYPIALSDESWDCDDVEGQGVIHAYKGQCSASLNPLEYQYHAQFDCDYWERYWTQIRTINVFLQHIPTAALNDERNRDRWAAEAHVLRAFFYLQLVKWYGAVPILKEPLASDADYSTLKKSSFKEIFEFIVDDCDQALLSEELPWHLTSSTYVWRMTKGIAEAIRSQASLYAASTLYCGGDNLWDWAYKVNKESYDALKANGYELYTQMHTSHYNSAYAEYFAQFGSFSESTVDKETIWQSLYLEEGMWYTWGTPAHNNYRAGDVPSQQLVDAYDMLATGKPVLNLAKPYLDSTCLQPNYAAGSGYNTNKPYDGRDPRFFATVLYNNCNILIGTTNTPIQTYTGGNCEWKDNDRRYTRTGYYAHKGMFYCSNTNYNGQDGRWKYYRLGEVYLNLAEAAIESNHIDEGLSLINEIRHRAGFSASVDVTASGIDEARLLLRHERQVELAYEEHRYFDVRRWTSPDEDLNNEKFCTGMKVTKSGLSYKYQRFLVGSDGITPSKMTYEKKYHFFPIPLSEASLMESLTGDTWQNAGW